MLYIAMWFTIEESWNQKSKNELNFWCLCELIHKKQLHYIAMKIFCLSMIGGQKKAKAATYSDIDTLVQQHREQRCCDLSADVHKYVHIPELSDSLPLKKEEEKRSLANIYTDVMFILQRIL
uniref:Uncharacterized protein n=1 Tax=Glossina palpalis gambiensis TaxID=67801 RepID=A0A1B0BLA7_9MUSC